MSALPFWAVGTTAFAACVCATLGLPALHPALERKATRSRKLHEELYQFDRDGWGVVRESIVLSAGAAIISFFLGGWVMAIPAAAAGYYLPERQLRKRVTTRFRQLDEQLPDAMSTLVNSLRSGQTLMQGIEESCRESLFPYPIRNEFEIMTREYALGATQHDVLERAKDRFRSKDFNMIVSAIKVTLDRGGNLTETLMRITNFMKEVARLRANIDIKTSGARKTATFMRFVPFLIVGVLYMSDPEGVMLLFTTLPGNVLVTGVAAMNLVAYLWTDSILEAEI